MVSAFLDLFRGITTSKSFGYTGIVKKIINPEYITPNTYVQILIQFFLFASYLIKIKKIT